MKFSIKQSCIIILVLILTASLSFAATVRKKVTGPTKITSGGSAQAIYSNPSSTTTYFKVVISSRDASGATHDNVTLYITDNGSQPGTGNIVWRDNVSGNSTKILDYGWIFNSDNQTLWATDNASGSMVDTLNITIFGATE